MKTDIQKLIDIMAKLRKPEGCPWDQEQSHETLKRFLVEEVYEVMEAIESGDFNALREELGDLLLQVVFHAQVAEEKGVFNMQDVINDICEKLVRRHPHVFRDSSGESKIDTATKVEIQWEDIKRREKKSPDDTERSAIDGVPLAMPSTLQAVRLTEKAARVGFDWESPEDVIDKIEEEIGELKVVLNKNNRKEIEHELGDLLFAISNLARHLNMDPEAVHRATLKRFRDRFKMMEKLAEDSGVDFAKLKLDEQEELWNKAKEILEDV